MQAEDYYLVGLSLARLGRDETALQVWQKGARVAGDHPELLESLAREAMATGHPVEAADAAGRLARLPGWDGRGWLLLGEARDQLDDPSAAADALERGLSGDRGSPRDRARYRRLLARLPAPARARGRCGRAARAGARRDRRGG